MQHRNIDSGAQEVLECNYADNYYGDQVCVLKKS